MGVRLGVNEVEKEVNFKKHRPVIFNKRHPILASNKSRRLISLTVREMRHVRT